MLGSTAKTLIRLFAVVDSSRYRFSRNRACIFRAVIKSPKLIFYNVKKENISTNHNLNLKRFGVIPHRKYVSSKNASKLDFDTLAVNSNLAKKSWFLA